MANSADPLMAYAALDDERRQLQAAIAQLRPATRALEAKVTEWVHARPSRRWLTTSVTAGRRFVACRGEAAVPRRAATPPPPTVIRQTTVNAGLLQAVGSVLVQALPQRDTPPVGFAGDICEAVVQAHARTRRADAVTRSRPQAAGPGRWLDQGPLGEGEKARFAAETKAPIHAEAPALSWPLLCVLKARQEAAAARLKAVRGQLKAATAGVAAALRRCDGQRVVLPDRTALALAPGPTRSTPYTKASVAKAVVAAVGGSVRDGAVARKIGVSVADALAKLDRQARAAEPRNRRKRGGECAAPVAKRGRWAKA